MDLIRLNPTIWPYSLSQLRLDEPHLSISLSPHDGELNALSELGIIVHRVVPTPCPETSRDYKYEEGTPVEEEGVWKQVWVRRDATPEEIDLWEAPSPNWGAFKVSALNNTSLNNAISSLYQNYPLAVNALVPSLLKVEQGDVGEFSVIWGSISPLIPQEVRDELIASAKLNNLPTTFVQTLIEQ
jgi:hypothetical protein